MELKQIGLECFDFNNIKIDTTEAAQDAMTQSAN